VVRPVVPVRFETARPSSSGRALMVGVLVLMVLGAAGWWRWVKTHEPVAPAPAHIVAEKSFSAQQEVVAARLILVPAAVPAEDCEALTGDLVERWRAAWTRRDVEAYLASYGPTFVPPKGQTRLQWNSARRDNLSSRASIEVVIHELRTESVGDRQMAVYFLLDYISPTYREKAERKTLLLDQVDGQWQIAGEWSGVFRALADL
jgi:hypothetical protein